MQLKALTYKKLSRNDAPLQLAALGVLAGLVAGLVVNLFRLVLEAPFPALGLVEDPDDFEALPAWLRFALPVAGCLLLIVLFRFFPAANRRLGVPHVIDKVQNLKGHMPLRNGLLQFAGGAISLLSGQSCGREGPAIHMGATSSSLIGQFFHLPNNSNRVLIACGSAAAIAASFNTPIAGVIFSMEVIMMEYSIAGFLPVIIAAVSGAVVTRFIYGDAPVFQIEEVGLSSFWELPYIVLMGLVIGILASFFIAIQKYCMTFSSIDYRKRLLLVGLLTGALALFMPEVMGTGYDTLNDALRVELALPFLALLLVAKLLITGVALGLGIPGGVIGPTLMMGGLAGAIMGNIGNALIENYAAQPAFYVLLGMCAMMGAVLQAPLAALMALLELSGNPNMILPAMLIIVVANLCASEFFGSQSIFQIALQQQGIKTPRTLSRLLNRYGVSSIMNTGVAVLRLDGEAPDVTAALSGEPDWIVLQRGEERRVLEARRLARRVSAGNADAAGLADAFEQAAPLAAVSLHDTLQEAMECLQNANLDAGFVYSPLGLKQGAVLGIITSDAIIAFYKDR